MSLLMAQLVAANASARPIEEQILDILADADAPLEVADVKVRLSGILIAHKRVREVLEAMVDAGQVVRLRGETARRQQPFVYLLPEREDELSGVLKEEPDEQTMVAVNVLARAEAMLSRLRAAGEEGLFRRQVSAYFPGLTESQVERGIQFLIDAGKAYRDGRRIVAVSPSGRVVSAKKGATNTTSNAGIVFDAIHAAGADGLRRRDLVRTIGALTAAQIDSSIQCLVKKKRVQRSEDKRLIAIMESQS